MTKHNMWPEYILFLVSLMLIIIYYWHKAHMQDAVLFSDIPVLQQHASWDQYANDVICI